MFCETSAFDNFSCIIDRIGIGSHGGNLLFRDFPHNILHPVHELRYNYVIGYLFHYTEIWRGLQWKVGQSVKRLPPFRSFNR